MVEANENSFFAPVEEGARNPFGEVQDLAQEEEEQQDQEEVVEEDEDDGDGDGDDEGFDEGYDIYEQSDFDDYFRYL